jgi:hypothetical protein
MSRVYIGNSRWTADDFIRALGVSADMPSNLVLTLFNEADSWGSSPRELEERMRVEVEFVRKARAIAAAQDLIQHHGYPKGDLEVHEFEINTVPSTIHPV